MRYKVLRDLGMDVNYRYLHPDENMEIVIDTIVRNFYVMLRRTCSAGHFLAACSSGLQLILYYVYYRYLHPDENMEIVIDTIVRNLYVMLRRTCSAGHFLAACSSALQLILYYVYVLAKN